MSAHGPQSFCRPGRRPVLQASLGFAALALAGCRTVGPDYAAPPAVVAPGAGFKHAAPAVAPAPAGDTWWTVFGDPALDALQTAALAGSPTLAAAVARIDEARARAGFVRADTDVTLNATGASRLAGETAERTIPLPGRPVTYRERGDTYRAALEAGYELDLWGRVRRALESAEAQIAATEADRRAVRLVLTADVAQAYFAARTLEQTAAVLERTKAVRTASVEVLRARFAAGLAPELDVNRAAVELAVLDAELADLARRREQAVNALAVLTGVAPAQLTFAAASAAPAPPPAIPAGLPSALLARRPDLAAAEAALRARTAEIGVAEAAKFPTIRLTGTAGFESAELGDLLERPSQFWQFGPSVTLPLLDGGRIEANLAVAQARAAGAAAEYRQRGLAALREVEDALVELRQQAEQVAAQTRAADAARTVVELATVRYERGYATYLEVIDAQRTVLQIERALAELAGARHAGTVRLIRALGGGWE